MSNNKNERNALPLEPALKNCIFDIKHSQVEMHNTQNTITHPMIDTSLTMYNYYNEVLYSHKK